jgi:F-type H+-transporting ATPase subunit delta
MIAKNNSKTFAKKLLYLSKDENSNLSEQRIKSILQILSNLPPTRLTPILKLYLKNLKNELQKNRAIIENAGKLSQKTINSIKQTLSQKYNRTITVTQRDNPDLIAGLRIRIADDLYDLSIAGRLQTIAQNIH